MTEDQKRNLSLKVPIFYMQPYLSAEQSKMEAQYAADNNYRQYDSERARSEIEKQSE